MKDHKDQGKELRKAVVVCSEYCRNTEILSKKALECYDKNKGEFDWDELCEADYYWELREDAKVFLGFFTGKNNEEILTNAEKESKIPALYLQIVE